MSFNPRTELSLTYRRELGCIPYSFYDLLRMDANDGTGSLLAPGSSRPRRSVLEVAAG